MTTQNDDPGGGAPPTPPAPPDDPQPAHPLHGMNADKAKGYVADQALDDLDAVEAAEKANPNNPGGRKSVLAAITDRRAKLTPPPTPADKDAAAETAEPDIEIVPEKNGTKDPRAIDMLLAACERYGVHPGLDRRPKELLSWAWYPGNRVDAVPDAVVIVTAGGVKLKTFADADYPIDSETDEKLHAIFNAFRVDKDTKLQVPVALPANLTLPDSAVTGQATTQRHRYVGGYLRRKADGKIEAGKAR